MAYLDAASDRLGRRRSGDFDALVEAVRVGTITAHDRKAADKWRRSVERRQAPKRRGLVGDALEAAVMGVAQMFPQNVIHGTV